MRRTVVCLVLILLCGGVFAEAIRPGTQIWRIELRSGIDCAEGRFYAGGTIEIDNSGLARGKLILYDGDQASFVTKLDQQNRISTNFLSENGEGFNIKGSYSKAQEQGTWESRTASCGGEWRAERLEK
jgi:hypothetical protein